MPLTPVEVILVRVDASALGQQLVPLGRLPGRWHTLRLTPEPDWPFGRKGLALLRTWQQIQMSRQEAGMVILDGDVAIDPVDYQAMMGSITREPGAVHAAPVRLWPRSTQWKAWTWAHHRGEPSQNDCDDPTVFSFSFTYLPRALIEGCGRAGMAKWTFPTCDSKVTQIAAQLHLPVRVVRDAHPTHLHY